MPLQLDGVNGLPVCDLQFIVMLDTMEAHKTCDKVFNFENGQAGLWRLYTKQWGTMCQKVYRKASSGTGAVMLPMALHVLLDAYKS